jgi:xylulose-5-phosphate/fructose-6-phosphate phosphoketolase
MVDERLRHRAYTREVGDDMADVRDWTWSAQAARGERAPGGSD